MATEVDQIQIKRGNLNAIPTFLDGEMGLAEDDSKGRIYYGTSSNGNRYCLNDQDMLTINNNIATINNIANTALGNSSTAISTSNQAVTTSNTVASELSSIVAQGGNDNTEIVAGRTAVGGTTYTTIGDHIRKIETNHNYSKLQSYTATADGTALIAITPTGLDLTKCELDIRYRNSILEVNTDYTIDIANYKISLNGWTLNNGEKLTYRVLVFY